VAARSLESFERRVGLFVTLVVAFVLAMGGLHAVHQYQAHLALEQQVRERARAAAGLVLAELGEERLRGELKAWRQRGTRPRILTGLSRSELRERGISSIELLSGDGWRLGASTQANKGEDPETAARLSQAVRRRLASGDVSVDLESGLGLAPEYAVAIAHAPVLDASAQLVGVLEVGVAAGPLARSRRDLRLSLGLQVAALLVFALLLGGFMRWTLRPLRLLAAAAGAPEEQDTAEYEKQDDTGFVIETYRRAIDDLRDKETELRRLRELERHRANELQDLNASIIDSMVSGVLVLDLSGRIRSFNEVGRQVLGVGDEPATGRPFADVLACVPELHGKLRACLERGEVIRRDDLRLNLPGIGRRDVGLTVSPLVDREGSRTGALCLVVDLTEIKHLQEQVRLKASLADLGELSGGIAHEFRNSLAAMLGYAKLVERQGEGEVVEHAREISAEIATLRRVVDDFLRFANPTRLVLEPIELGALMEDLRDDVRQRAGDKAVSLDIAGDLPSISGDETLLRRAFTNLLRNAADAVGSGGRIRVAGRASGGELELLIEDDGPGIAEDDAEKIFLPFVSRKDEGTGLGLALTRKILVHHGGRISAQASELGGACFRVVLPLRDERKTNATGGSPEPGAGHEK
jgi:PAS domain S-box-containing protein